MIPTSMSCQLRLRSQKSLETGQSKADNQPVIPDNPAPLLCGLIYLLRSLVSARGSAMNMYTFSKKCTADCDSMLKCRVPQHARLLNQLDKTCAPKEVSTDCTFCLATALDYLYPRHTQTQRRTLVFPQTSSRPMRKIGTTSSHNRNLKSKSKTEALMLSREVAAKIRSSWAPLPTLRMVCLAA